MWLGKIAIPYASDYGYATDFNHCNRLIADYAPNTLNSYCTSYNWMSHIFATGGFEWLLTPSGSQNGSLYVGSLGSVGDILDQTYETYNTYHVYGVVPTLHLISDLDIKSGSGTSSDPYQLDV